MTVLQLAPRVEPLQPNTDLAVAVLTSLSGRHDLAAIDPDKERDDPGHIECATFQPNERQQMRQWIEQRQGKFNLYYTVNEAEADAPKNKRLSKADIGFIRAVFVDLDPKKKKKGDLTGEYFARERERLYDVVAALGNETCRPNLIIDSGGGYQALWVLKEKRPNAEVQTEAEGIGRTLKDRFGGDSIMDVSRLLRIPGTINIPSENKRAQGRGPALATVPYELTGAMSPKYYSFAELAAWAPPTAPQSKASNSALVAVDMDAISDVIVYEDVPEATRQKFERAREKHPALNGLWNGNKAPWQNDETRSGFALALARPLKRAGFTATEFGSW